MITTPEHPALERLCALLREGSNGLEETANWPARQLAECAEAGVFRWFVPHARGGLEWSEEDIVRGYLELGAACLTTTFIITQFMGAVTRLAAVGSEELLREWLPDLLSGKRFATLGISHLTTSRQHLAAPVLRATPAQGGYLLDGYSPWVTGAPQADGVVLGATLESGAQILMLLSAASIGVSTAPSARLVGLAASQTGELHCNRVFVADRYLLAGPAENVMQTALRAKTGGLQTSTLALALAREAIEFLEREGAVRAGLQTPAVALRNEWRGATNDLLSLAAGQEPCTVETLRARANSLVLRATQAALGAAKGSGYVLGHPAGRWCKEALFFLVWSCPQSVLNANLCELAGL